MKLQYTVSEGNADESVSLPEHGKNRFAILRIPFRYREESEERRAEELKIRNAEKKDIGDILRLLKQVLELHAELRPDVFISGTTKYTESELLEILTAEERRTYVAADEQDHVLGYAMCILRKQPNSNNMVPFTSFFIDDLCVDREVRGKKIGRALFDYAKEEAGRLGCYEVTLNVWEGNEGARSFYEKMGMKPKETQMEYILE